MTTGTPDPVILVMDGAGCEPRAAALADILIVPPDERSVPEQCANLLTRYPGLTLVVVPVGPGRLTAEFRDGGAAVVNARCPGADGTESAVCVARFLYRWRLLAAVVLPRRLTIPRLDPVTDPAD